MSLKYIIILLVGFLCSNCNTQNVPTIEITAKQEKSIDEIFEAYQNNESPGVAVAVIRKDEVVFQKGYGLANVELGESIEPERSVFALASISKQFTVMAILLLEEKGLLSLDDDIRKYIPELSDFGYKITLKHLASNTSGFRSDLQLMGMKGFTNDDEITKQMIHEVIFNQKELNFEPGEEFRYSNSGFALLAEVVERVSNKPFATFMKTELFDPLKMHNTFVMDDFSRTEKHLALCYAFYNNTYVNDPLKYSFVGSTGIFTTLSDFSKWAINFKKQKIGTAQSFKKMNTPVLLNNGKFAPYALGQFIEVYNGMDQIQHGGGSASYRTYIGRFPKEELIVLLLSNVGNINVQQKAMEVVDLFLNPMKKSALTSTKETKFIKGTASALKSYEGKFLHTLNNYVRKIEWRDDTLRYIRTEQNNRESVLLPLDETTFQLGHHQDIQVVFKMDEGIEFMHLLIDGEVEDRLIKFKQKNYPEEELEQFIGKYFCPELNTSYSIELEAGVLYSTHPKMRQIQLIPAMEDVFLTDTWRFSVLKIQRATDSNKIEGFRISSDRVRNVFFKKEH